MYRIQYLVGLLMASLKLNLTSQYLVALLMSSLKLNLTSVCVWYTLAAVVKFMGITLYKFILLLLLCVLLCKKQLQVHTLGLHKYSTTFHMLQQIVFMRKLSASVFVRVNYTCVMP